MENCWSSTDSHPSLGAAPLPYWPTEADPPPCAQPGPWCLAALDAAQGSCHGQDQYPEKSRGRGGQTRLPRWQGSHNRSNAAWHWPWWPSEHRLTLCCREREREKEEVFISLFPFLSALSLWRCLSFNNSAPNSAHWMLFMLNHSLCSPPYLWNSTLLSSAACTFYTLRCDEPAGQTFTGSHEQLTAGRVRGHTLSQHCENQKSSHTATHADLDMYVIQYHLIYISFSHILVSPQ